MGYPGGKAKIIHKESDIIMAFAINRVSYKLEVSHHFWIISPDVSWKELLVK